jgi:hypothetical protein
VLHVWSDYAPPDARERARFAVALASWGAAGWRELRVTDDELPRHWSERGKRLPFVVDVVDRAIAAAAPGEIIVLTNRDTVTRPGVVEDLEIFLRTRPACYGRRRNRNGITLPLDNSWFDDGKEDGGTDLFAARREWWKVQRPELDGFLLGVDPWDAIATYLVDGWSSAAHVPGLVLHDHDGRKPWWFRPLSRPGARPYLHGLAREFFKRHGVDWERTPFGSWFRHLPARAVERTDPRNFIVPNLTGSRP